MSIKDLADELAAKGRYGDTELVHMTKGEVAGLQGLAEAAGGSLTINPETGKPEAFFLAALLPTILGAAAPALGAAATGAGLTGLGGFLSGKFGAMGLGALAGGLMNRQNPLLGAITGGLGGAGGAGLAKGLTGVGAGAAQNAAVTGLTGPANVANTMAAGVDPMLANAIRPELMSQAAQGATGATNLAAANATNQFMAQPFTTQVGQGAKALMQPGGPSQLLQSMGGASGALKTGAMAAAPLAGGLMSQRPMEIPEETGSIPEYDFAYNPTGYTTRGSEELMQFRPTFTRRAAAGGIMSLAEGGDTGIAALARGGMKAGGFVIPADVVSMIGEGNTDAGYEQIKSMLPGATPIKGKDGGQADTVKTSIEGKQPARVAHGEMYVPPETVKKAGGAKKLYAMMKNVRKQAKGDDKQIEPVDLRKAMA